MTGVLRRRGFLKALSLAGTGAVLSILGLRNSRESVPLFASQPEKSIPLYLSQTGNDVWGFTPDAARAEGGLVDAGSGVLGIATDRRASTPIYRAV